MAGWTGKPCSLAWFASWLQPWAFTAALDYRWLVQLSTIDYDRIQYGPLTLNVETCTLHWRSPFSFVINRAAFFDSVLYPHCFITLFCIAFDSLDSGAGLIDARSLNWIDPELHSHTQIEQIPQFDKCQRSEPLEARTRAKVLKQQSLLCIPFQL